MHCINDELFDLAKKSCEVRPLAGAKHKHYDSVMVFLFCYN